MTAFWKLAVEARLMKSSTPEVLTSGMVQAMARFTQHEEPSPATFQRWLKDMTATGKLQPVIRGVYLNRMGHNDVSPAAASHWIRSRSIVSLCWVLEQAGVTNNFGGAITCVIPTDPTWTNPQVGERKTTAGVFGFYAMPARLLNLGEVTDKLDDIQDSHFDYPRATPEKALLDWIYLGASHRSRMTLPPMDLQIGSMDKRKLRRLSKQMAIQGHLNDWLARYERHQSSLDVQQNAAVGWDL